MMVVYVKLSHFSDFQLSRVYWCGQLCNGHCQVDIGSYRSWPETTWFAGKRNTALVVLGLLVGSAIVTSSLVIGDSLDATMEEQFLAPLGDTDYYIKGNDKATGLLTEWNESRATEIAEELLSGHRFKALGQDCR